MESIEGADAVRRPSGDRRSRSVGIRAGEACRRPEEQDPGNEFRQKIRLLERNLADSRDKSKSLETQLDQAKQHVEQYKSMSLANEEALRDLNKTSEEFRSVDQ